MLEGLVLAWGAQHFYQVWSRLYAIVVAIRLPWQTKNELEVKDGSEDEEVTRSKKVRYHQAAIDARNE